MGSLFDLQQRTATSSQGKTPELRPNAEGPQRRENGASEKAREASNYWSGLSNSSVCRVIGVSCTIQCRYMEISWWIRSLAQICGGEEREDREGAEVCPPFLGGCNWQHSASKKPGGGGCEMTDRGCCVYSGCSGRWPHSGMRDAALAPHKRGKELTTATNLGAGRCTFHNGHHKKGGKEIP